jgi:hypothetical protein
MRRPAATRSTIKVTSGFNRGAIMALNPRRSLNYQCARASAFALDCRYGWVLPVADEDCR